MEDILALRLFLAIADTAGFTHAARRLSLTPAVASRKLAALEAEIGQRLFLRSTRKVSLTEHGALLRQHAQRVVDTPSTTDEAMRGALARPAGRLRISCRAGLGSYFIVPFIPEFRATYPEVTIGLELMHSRQGDLIGHRLRCCRDHRPAGFEPHGTASGRDRLASLCQSPRLPRPTRHTAQRTEY